MKKIIKFIFWFLIIAAAVVLIGGFIFLKTFDLNKYKSYAEELVYKQTGRKLSLAGDADIKVSLIPTVVLNDVSLSNADWAASQDMIKAAQIEVSMDILPLLKKQLVINTVNLIDPQVYLTVNKDGTPNWIFRPVDSANALTENKNEKEPAVEAAKTAAVMGIVAKHLRIENGTVVYEDLKNTNTQNVKIKAFNLNSAGMDDNINLDFDLNYNGNEITGDAETGSINSVLQNHPNFPLKANVKAFGAAVQADLKLNNLMGDLSFAGTLHASNPSGNFGAPAVKLDTTLSGSLKEIIAVLNNLDVAGNVVTGKLNVNLEQAKPFITGNIESQSVNLESFSQPKKSAMRFELISSAAAASFVPDTALDLSALNSVNAKIKLAVGKLVVNEDLSVENIELTATLNNGQLNLQPFSLRAGGGLISGQASVSALSNQISLNLKGENIVLQDFLKQLALHDGTSFGFKNGGKTDLKISLRGQGASVRKIIESLDGQVIVIVGESKIQTGSLKYLSGNFITQVLNSLNLKKATGMDLKCAVVRTDLANGKAQFPKGIVFNAEQMVLVGDGSVNLVNDKLNFTLHPFNSKLTDNNIAQAISSLLKISGTVENPKLTLDNASVIKNVVGVAAAGPAYLGSQMLLEADSSPCYTALKGTDYQNMFPAPAGVKAAGQGLYQGTNELINDSVSAIKDTAKDVLNIFKKK